MITAIREKKDILHEGINHATGKKRNPLKHTHAQQSGGVFIRNYS